MNTEPLLSSDFKRLYCDSSVFDSFSSFHPINFRRVLPFQSEDRVVDDRHLIHAEEACLADRMNTATQERVLEEYSRCGVLSAAEASSLKAAGEFHDAEFFETMGSVYANAGMFRCALRWYRERIRKLESQTPGSRSDEESVHAGVGYCLYSLGLFEEAISWSKSCIGPRQIADVVCQALIAYEAEAAGGLIQGIERSANRTRYTVRVPDPDAAGERIARLEVAMKAFAPVHYVYMDWTNREVAVDVSSGDRPFKTERDAGSLLEHKMNLIFASCGHADALAGKGYNVEAKRVLTEAAMLEPNATFVLEKLQALRV